MGRLIYKGNPLNSTQNVAEAIKYENDVTVKDALDDIPVIDSGHGVGSKTGFIHVAFNKTFSTIPSVVGSISVHGSGASASATVAIFKAFNVDTSGFDAITIANGAYDNTQFDWVAIGK